MPICKLTGSTEARRFYSWFFYAVNLLTLCACEHKKNYFEVKCLCSVFFCFVICMSRLTSTKKKTWTKPIGLANVAPAWEASMARNIMHSRRKYCNCSFNGYFLSPGETPLIMQFPKRRNCRNRVPVVRRNPEIRVTHHMCWSVF